MFRFLLAATLLIASPLWAQPAIDAPPKAVNPPNEAPAFPTEEQQKKMADDTEALMKMTPEQQKAEMRKMQNEILRNQMIGSGFVDTKLQDRIITFVDEQETSRQQLRKIAEQISISLDVKQGIPANEKMNELLNLYLNTAEETKKNREIAIQNLDKELVLSKQPYLKAFLHLNGIIGETSGLTGEIVVMGNISQAAISQGPLVER